MNIYMDLTQHFNTGRLRAILSSGQAVVLHRLAVMSKDGDWIVKEDDEALHHILQILHESGARYRFSAPLDRRWLAGGWSSHFEFTRDQLRVRTDFVSRPPRIGAERLARIWSDQENRAFPFVNLVDLAELKKTNREKDYAVIGELSRRMTAGEDQVRYSRSAREILDFFRESPSEVAALLAERGIGTKALKNRESLEAALDAERRRLIHANERRLARYAAAARAWVEIWKDVERALAGLPLLEAHGIVVKRAEGVLPFTLPEGTDHGGDS
jgi:hypothetical protein